MKLIFSFFLVFYYFFFIFFSFVKADILINEIMPNPSDDREWIELYNNSLQEASLSGFLLKDQLSSPSIIYEFSNEIILGKSYLVVDLSSAKLNNSADGVSFFDSQGEIVDEISYLNAPIDLSWSRMTEGLFIFTEPTKNLVNLEPTLVPTSTPIPTPIPTSNPTPTPSLNFDFSKIQISEFVACALTDQSEWVEFYNSSDQDLNNFDFILENQNGTKKEFIGFSLDSDEYKVVTMTSSFLTNSGGTLSFIINGETIEKISYEACVKGESFIKQGGIWLETDQITKGQENAWIDISGSSSSTSSSGNEDDNEVLSDESSDEDQSQSSLTIKEIDYQIPNLKLTTQKNSREVLAKSVNQNKEMVSESSLEGQVKLDNGEGDTRIFGVIILGLILLASGFLGLYVVYIKNKENEQIY